MNSRPEHVVKLLNILCLHTMSVPMHSLTVLITAAQWEALAALAEENNTNMSDLASKMVGQEIDDHIAAARYQEIEAERFNLQCAVEKEVKYSFLDNWSDNEISSEERNACDQYNERFVTSVW